MNTTMSNVVEHAYAKLNLFLKVFDRQEDGYHRIATLMGPLELFDRVELTLRKGQGAVNCSVSSGFSDGQLPQRVIDGELCHELSSQDNLAVNAAKLFLSASGHLDSYDLDIVICKRIPVQAGLGGGSANAAAVFRGLARMLPHSLSLMDLLSLASGLGADVAGLLVEGPVYCCEAGSKVENVSKGKEFSRWQFLSECPLILIKPAESVSTRWAYGELNRALGSKDNTLEQSLIGRNLLESFGLLSVSDLGDVSFCQVSDSTDRPEVEVWQKGKPDSFWLEQGICNDFQALISGACPGVRDALEFLGAAGAIATTLCGSGSAVAGFFPHNSTIESFARLSRQAPTDWLLYRTFLRKW